MASTPRQRGARAARRRPRRSAPAAARERILAAAATVFAQKGFYGGRIEDVAREAGYSPAALYRHFGGRDELFGEIWRRVAEDLAAIFARAAEQQGRFETRLRGLVLELARRLETEPDLVAAFVSQRPYGTKARGDELERAALAQYRRHLALLTVFMESGVREGAVREGLAAPAALLLKALLFEFAHRWLTADAPPDLSVEVDVLLDLFGRGAGTIHRETRGS
jgi:TetR/AcrR family fatty acid metabolism transcriptional regulator